MKAAPTFLHPTAGRADGSVVLLDAAHSGRVSTCSSASNREELYLNEIDLTGKTAIVTGSSAGIGWGCARGLAEVGATVVLTGRDSSALGDACNRLAAAISGATIRSVPSI